MLNIKNICYIVGAGEMNQTFAPTENDMVIAADGGYNHLKKAGIKPDIIIGDFDSLQEKPTGDNVVSFPVMKDDTDTMLAIKAGLEKGFKSFVIYGGMGGRLDHTLANVQALSYIANRGGRGYLLSENENITVIKNSNLKFDKSSRGYISVFSVGGIATGVYLDGLMYPLNNATVTTDFPIGVSNKFTGKEATVTVKDGMLAVMWYGDIKNIL